MKNSDANYRLAQTIIKIDGAYAPSTIRAYVADFRDFITFCDLNNQIALPALPATITGYMTKLIEQGRCSSSIRRALAGISTIHNINEVANPTIRSEMKLGVRRMQRQLGRFNHQAEGITKHILDDMLACTDNSLRGYRDRAMLLVGYDTMCRRSELVSLRIEDISTQLLDRKNNILSTVIFLRKSKTDQESHGRWIPISQVATEALNKWLSCAEINTGLIFRGVNRGYKKATQRLSPGQVSRIYKRIASLAGFDQGFVRHISGHSIRVGAAQDLLLSGASLPMIMARGRWSKADTVMRYVEKIGIPV
jgi:site-specific recombinase XerD